jgi:hypothetical protein
MKRTKKVFKIFWAWQDHNEEVWLNQMAKKGWALKSYQFFYTFEKIEPESYIYKLDYKASRDDDLEEYKQIFADTGWEYVTRYGAWHYFRTLETEETTPEIYTENEYQIEKYKGLLQGLTSALITIIILAATTYILSQSAFLKGALTTLLALIALSILKINQKINRLKE